MGRAEEMALNGFRWVGWDCGARVKRGICCNVRVYCKVEYTVRYSICFIRSLCDVYSRLGMDRRAHSSSLWRSSFLRGCNCHKETISAIGQFYGRSV